MSKAYTQSAAIEKAATWIMKSSKLLITAGAGIGIDSGLPDFRGPEGFWAAYPAFKANRLSFQDAASPAMFRNDPELAWGFYGHRLKMYRETSPHAGFHNLLQWAVSKDSFIFTSNVDGQFQKAGFSINKIVECHGRLNTLQCSVPCMSETWSARSFNPEIDENSQRLVGALPRCIRCGELARPNVLMFGDNSWVSDETDVRLSVFNDWLNRGRPMGLENEDVLDSVVIEIGAGTAVSTVRNLGTNLANSAGWSASALASLVLPTLC